MAEEVGTFTLPVILSFRDSGKQAEKDLKASFGKLGDIGKRAGKDIGAGVSDGAAAAEAAVKKSTDKILALQDKQADAADKVRLAEERLAEAREKGLTGSRLTSAQNAREKALRAEAALIRNVEDETKSLQRAQQQLASGGGMGAGAGGESAGESFVDGFGGAIAAIGTKAGPIGLALAAAGGLALAGGGIIGKQVLAGMDREVSADRLQAQLGLNDAEAAQFGRSAGEVYGDNFGESLDDVSEAMAAVSSTLGQSSGAVLEGITAKALTFRDVFGTDIPESIAAAQNLIVNGLAPDADSAFDLMTTAYQRVPAAMRDELPEILNEYSTNFESLGFSGAEAFGLLVNTAPKGAIALDKLGDSLKEFTLLATDVGSKSVQDALSGMGLNGQDVANNILAGGDTAQQQFDGIVDKLLEIKDPADQAAAAIALFGTPLEDLDKAKIPEFLTSLNNADTAMQGFSGSAQRMVDTVGDNAANSLETASRSIETALGSMQTGLADAFGPQIEQFGTWISEHGPEITEFFGMVGQVAVTAAGGVLLFAAESIGALADVTNVIGDALGGMATVGAEVFDLLGQSDKADGLRDFAEDSFGLADSLYAAEEGARAAVGAMEDASTQFGKTREQAQRVGENVDRIAQIMRQLPDGKDIDISAIVTYKDSEGLVIPPDQLSASAPRQYQTPTGAERRGRAYGGPITGPGGPRSDLIPIWASNGEHMLPADEVAALGGQKGVYALRSVIRSGAFGKFADGGAIEDAESLAASMDGLPYVYGQRDCSKVQSDVYAALTGKPTSSRYFTTESDFESLGFVKGYMPGAYNIGVRRGGGGKLSHMAGTLPNGVRFEAGGADSTVKYGGAASGAEDFPLQWYLPVNGGDGGAVSGSGGVDTSGSPGLSGGSSGGSSGGGVSSGASGGSGGGGGLGQFGEVGSIASSFLKDTFGIDGSFFPDLSNLAPVQAAGTLLEAFSGPLQGFLDGGLGIQQPGWTPGQPVAALADTGSSAFGMPDPTAPPMPADGVHTGSGIAPGPITQHVDQSVNYSGPVGWDPVDVQRNLRRDQERRTLPRISGMGMGT